MLLSLLFERTDLNVGRQTCELMANIQKSLTEGKGDFRFREYLVLAYNHCWFIRNDPEYA